MNWRDVVNTSFDSKGGDLCEARNRERREMERSHVPDRSRGAKMCVDPGNEHKEKPSGASTIKGSGDCRKATNHGTKSGRKTNMEEQGTTNHSREGVNQKERKWYSLIDKIWAKPNLEEAFKEVKRNRGSAGIDRMTIQAFESQLEHHLEVVQQTLKNKTYHPKPVRRVYIPKADGTQRPLGIPTVGDRVVQAATRRILEPIYES